MQSGGDGAGRQRPEGSAELGSPNAATAGTQVASPAWRTGFFLDE